MWESIEEINALLEELKLLVGLQQLWEYHWRGLCWSWVFRIVLLVPKMTAVTRGAVAQDVVVWWCCTAAGNQICSSWHSSKPNWCSSFVLCRLFLERNSRFYLLPHLLQPKIVAVDVMELLNRLQNTSETLETSALGGWWLCVCVCVCAGVEIWEVVWEKIRLLKTRFGGIPQVWELGYKLVGSWKCTDDMDLTCMFWEIS